MVEVRKHRRRKKKGGATTVRKHTRRVRGSMSRALPDWKRKHLENILLDERAFHGILDDLEADFRTAKTESERRDVIERILRHQGVAARGVIRSETQGNKGLMKRYQAAEESARALRERLDPSDKYFNELMG